MPVITYRQALNDTLGEELARDPNVLLMGEEIGKFQGSYRITEGLLTEFGDAELGLLVAPRKLFVAPVRLGLNWFDLQPTGPESA